jgi:outer membrane protein OmpA-like peptidoglycan-associated protein
VAWPAWVQRCGVGSTCNCGTQDGHGARQDIQRATSGGGFPLRGAQCSRFERAFDHDFSSVQLHTGADAHNAATGLQANALTSGTDILFRSGAYAPDTDAGDRLLAHELAHVVQQAKGLPRSALDGGASDPLERAADNAAAKASRAPPSAGPHHEPGPGGHRPPAAQTQRQHDGAVQRQAQGRPRMSRRQEILLSQVSPGGAEIAPKISLLTLFNFAIDSPHPKPFHVALLAELARFLQHEVPVPGRIRLTGHTDSSGSSARNAKLSSERAATAATTLRAFGVEAMAFAAGETEPVMSNATVDGRSRNRRVELRISATPGPARRPDRPPDDTTSFCDRYPLLCGIIPVSVPWPFLCALAPEFCAMLPCTIAPELCIPEPPSPPDEPKPPEDGGAHVDFGRVRALNTPEAMGDRIPDQGAVTVLAVVSGCQPSQGPIRVRVTSTGSANGVALVNGAAETDILGTSPLQVAGTAQTSPRAGAFVLRLEAVLGGRTIGRSAPFAVVAIMENMSTVTGEVGVYPTGVSLFALMSKQSDGKDGLGSLREMEYGEHLVILEEAGGMVGFGLGDYGDLVLADRDQLDEHGTPADYLHQLGRQKILQVHSMFDHRTRTRGVPVANSGFAVTREVTSDPGRGAGRLRFMVTKTGETGEADGIRSGAGSGRAELDVPLPSGGDDGGPGPGTHEPRVGPGGAPGAKESAAPISWEEAWQVLDAIADIINQFVDIREGLGYDLSTPAAHKDVPDRWQPLLQEWWLIANGTVRYPDGMTVSYRGDFLSAHIDRAVQDTTPLVRALLAEGDKNTGPWVQRYYSDMVDKFRARAVRDAVSETIDRAAEQGVGGTLDIGALDEITKLRIGSSQALKLTRAVLTVATRTASVNAKNAAKLDQLYAEAMGLKDMPASLRTTRATNLLTALTYVQGGLNLVQAIVNVADPEKRLEIYRQHQERFGRVAGYTEMLKNLGQFVSGAATVAGAGTYAVASVLGKAELAAKALSLGSSALGKINTALNVFAVIHGIAVLCNDAATPEERIEAGVEAAAGGLGLAGKFVPVLAPYAAAASASLLINFYAFKGLLEATAGAVTGLISLGLNISYAYLHETAQALSWTGMRYAAALDLAASVQQPTKAVELARQTEALRWNLVELTIKPFMQSATRPGGNRDPGTYEILRARFLPLSNARLETPEQVIEFTARLLQVITSCFTDAEQIYREQVNYTWEHHAD